MTTERSSPTVRMVELATRLRALRVARGLSIEEVAAELLCSSSKISRLETAARPASLRDVRDLCRLYEVDASEQALLMELSRQAKERAWWQQESSLSADTSTYIGLERVARRILSSHNLAVTGLLQTPDYARALLHGVRPPGTFSADDIEQRVKVRLRRQELLDRDDGPDLRVVLDDSVLKRPIGSAAVMTRQVEFLREAAEKPTVTLQVIPFRAGAHPGLDGRFVVLGFDSTTVPDVVYIEGLLGELFLDKPSDVARYESIFDYMTASVALGVEESRRYLDWARSAWSSGRPPEGSP